MDLKILQIASNTENNKIVKNHTHNAKLKNPICGDEMEISLNIKKNVIVDIAYQCKSCVYCQASVSLLSRNIINLSVDKVKILLNIIEVFFSEKSKEFPKEWKVFKKIFTKENISRKECLLLPFKTLIKALNSL